MTTMPVVPFYGPQTLAATPTLRRVRRINRAATKGIAWTRANAVALIVGFIVLSMVLSKLGYAGAIILLVFVGCTGISLAVERHRDGTGTFWFSRRAWAGTGLAIAVPVLMLATGSAPWHVSLILLIGYAIVAHFLDPQRTAKPTWWQTHDVISSALVKAKVFAAGDDPTVLFPGTAVIDEHGVKQTLRLPGKHWETAQKATPALAAALGAHEHLVSVTHHRDQPADVFDLWVGRADPKDLAGTISPATAATSTRWDDPVRIGRDAQGQPVCIQTSEANTLIAGTMGFGKTTVARPIITQFLLDPTAVIYALDGKGSHKDYASLRPHCARFVSGTDENAAEDLTAMLHDVLTVVRQRNSALEQDRYDGVLLMLEELQDVRASADKDLQAEIDKTLGRIIRMGRAVGVCVVISTQLPSVLDLPSGIRNLISQGLALKLRSGDYKMVLGDTPRGIAMPSERGEAILALPGGHTAVWTDAFPLEDWKAVCARARTTATPVPSVVLTKGSPVDDDAPMTLHDVVLDILATEGPVSATDIYTWLPRDLAPTTPAVLGKLLAGYPELAKGFKGKRPVWRLQPSVVPSDRGANRAPGRSQADSDTMPLVLAVSP